MAVACKKGKDLWSKVVVACKEKDKKQDKMVVACIVSNSVFFHQQSKIILVFAYVLSKTELFVLVLFLIK